MTPDRVAEALAALEAAEKSLGRDCSDYQLKREGLALIRDAAPALLKLARDYHHLEWDSPLLDELAQAVLGPEPGQ